MLNPVLADFGASLLWAAFMLAVSTIITIATAPKPKIKSASAEDFDFPTAEEGRIVPLLFGTCRIEGPNVLWVGDFQRKARKKSSLFGSVTVGYRYFWGTHFGICAGPIDGGKQIWVGGHCVWPGSEKVTVYSPLLAILQGEGTKTEFQEDPSVLAADGATSASIDARNVFGGYTGEGGIAGRVDFAYGASDQTRNDYLQAKIATNIPAFRGITCAIARHVYIGIQPHPYPWSFLCKRVDLLADGSTQWYPEKAPIGSERAAWYRFESDGVTADAQGGNDLTNHGVTTSADHKGGATSGAFDVDAQQYEEATDASLDDGFPLKSSGGETEISSTGWCKLASLPINQGNGIGERQIFEKWTDPSKKSLALVVGLRPGDASKADFQLWQGYGDGSAGRVLASMGPVQTGRWYFYAVSYDDTDYSYRLTVWDDTAGGLLAADVTGTAASAIAVNDSPLVIGWRGDHPAPGAGAWNWDGWLDEIAFYRGVLSAGDIAAARAGTYESGIDLNPAHAIRELKSLGLILEGEDPTTEIDDTSFTEAADTLYDEAMGVSCILDKSTPEAVVDLIGEILEVIDGALYPDPSTGLWKLELARDEYIVGELETFDESDILYVEEFTRSLPGQVAGQVAVHWRDRFYNTERVAYDDDISVIERQGGNVVTKDFSYPCIRRESMARKVAARKIKQCASMLASMRIVANRNMSHLHPNSVFKLSYAPRGIASMIVRVLSINYGSLTDGQVTLECVEDVFGTAYTVYGTSTEAAADAVNPTVALSYTVAGTTVSGQAEIDYNGVQYQGTLPTTSDPVIWWNSLTNSFGSGAADPGVPGTFVIAENDAGDISASYGVEETIELTDTWQLATDEADNLSLQHYDSSSLSWIDQTIWNPTTRRTKAWGLEVAEGAIYESMIDNGNSNLNKPIDWTKSNNQLVTLTNDWIAEFVAPAGPAGLILIVKQDAVGGRTPTLPANVKPVDSTALAFSTAANAVDILTLRYDGTTYWAALLTNFGTPA